MVIECLFAEGRGDGVGAGVAWGGGGSLGVWGAGRDRKTVRVFGVWGGGRREGKGTFVNRVPRDKLGCQVRLFCGPECVPSGGGGT